MIEQRLRRRVAAIAAVSAEVLGAVGELAEVLADLVAPEDPPAADSPGRAAPAAASPVQSASSTGGTSASDAEHDVALLARLSTRELLPLLADLSPEALARLHAAESAGRERATVLDAVERALLRAT